MFRGCQNKEELKFVYAQILRCCFGVIKHSWLAFYNCDLACDKTEFEAGLKICTYKNGKLETINFEGCTDKICASNDWTH